MEPAGISVVIPTFKRPGLLRKCLVALCSQAFAGSGPYEVIIVSDGPDPDTENLVSTLAAAHPGVLRYLHLDRKRGPAAARNLGWRQSTGKLVVFTDDDCIPDPGFLAAYWHAFETQDQQLIAFTGKVIVPVPARPTDYEKNVAHLSTAEFVTANCACSRSALEATGGFDEEFPAAWREDSDLHFRLLENNIPILKIKEAMVFHPARAARWGVSLAEQRKSFFNALLFKKHPGFYRSRIAAGPVWNYYAIIAATVTAVLAFALNEPGIGVAALAVWAFSLLIFIGKRLKGTDISLSHRTEMIITSLLIPYLSVYWTIRGALRYNVFFL